MKTKITHNTRIPHFLLTILTCIIKENVTPKYHVAFTASPNVTEEVKKQVDYCLKHKEFIELED